MDAADDLVLIDFLADFLADRAAGTVRPLAEYLDRHRGDAERIARHYLEFVDAERRACPDAKERTIGPYRLIEEIGRGGQGVVWVAEHRTLSRRVALKLLHPGRWHGDDARVRFMREAEIASRLDHPGLCTVYETGRDDEQDWIAMRLVRGRSLAACIRDSDGPLRLDRDASRRACIDVIANLVRELAMALDVAHEAGIVHRDVKPGNVIVSDDDGHPVLLDFGLARDDSAAVSLTLSGEVFGTPDTMAPEQVTSSRGIDRRADVWALGCILYECLTGVRPFAAPTVEGVLARIRTDEPLRPSRLDHAVPRDLDVIVATALEKDRERRYQTAWILAEELRRVVAREPILARPAGPWLRARRFAERNPAAAIALLVFFIAAAAVGWFARQTGVARAGLLRLDDYLRAEELAAQESHALWPVAPELVPRGDAWLTDARERVGRRDEYRRELAELDRDDGSLRGTLSDLVHRLDVLHDRIAGVEDRVARARSLRARSIDDHAEAWRGCRAAVLASATYHGLDLDPQIGIVPLGENEQGLWEFWHVESGSRPPRDASTGRVSLEPTSGIVLVLVPGARVTLGLTAVERDAGMSNANEVPREADLAPYFLSKFETTQAQWLLAMNAENPSTYPAGYDLHGEADVGWTNPVETVSFHAAERMAARLDLEIPTEAQWEAAARAGMATPWTFGCDTTCARAAANFYGREMQDAASSSQPMEEPDPFKRTAPAGWGAPNGYGFHDVHGNVFEWCRDLYVFRPARLSAGDGAPPPGESEDARRLIKGGSFLRLAIHARLALRAPLGADEVSPDVGFRTARDVR